MVTIQREMADRLCAAPASPAYGAVSVVVQALADVSIIRALPPSVFWPRPKVDSAVVAIRPDPQKRAAVVDVAGFHGLVRRVFLHRRKYLRHALAGMWPERWTKAEVDRWLESQGQSGQIRAEALDVAEFVALARALRDRFGELPEASQARRREAGPKATRETMHQPAIELSVSTGGESEIADSMRALADRSARLRLPSPSPAWAGGSWGARGDPWWEPGYPGTGTRRGRPFRSRCGQLGRGRFRVSSNPRDGLVELEAKPVHVVEIKQIRRDHGRRAWHGSSRPHRARRLGRRRAARPP